MAATEAEGPSVPSSIEDGAGQVIVRPLRHLSIWSIGAGFEGTASDWTEYVVLVVSFISLIWFLWSKNVMALPDVDIADLKLDVDDDVDHDEEDEGGDRGEGDGHPEEQAVEAEANKADSETESPSQPTLRKRPGAHVQQDDLAASGDSHPGKAATDNS